MSVSLRTPQMTREAFFDWAQAQNERYEFDGFEPVAMTGGTNTHGMICHNLWGVLRPALKGSGCTVLGPDAGLATVGNAVRYPDALVTCDQVPGADRVVPGVAIVFEVVSPTSGRMDRIVKVREYGAVASIRRYAIVEYASLGATVLSRALGAESWTAITLTEGDVLDLPEIGVRLPLDDLYGGIEFPATPEAERA